MCQVVVACVLPCLVCFGCRRRSPNRADSVDHAASAASGANAASATEHDAVILDNKPSVTPPML